MQFVPSFAPGRVELLGNHTDYNEGVVLSAALDFGISARGQPGVHGARLTGGGFGGAIVALVEAEAIGTIAPAVEAEYQKKTGHKGTAYRCAISDGAFVLAGRE